MQKPKRNAKNRPNPHTFISPFSLEECVARLPTGTGNYTDPDTYTFDAAPIPKGRGMRLKMQVTLQRTADNQTLVQGNIKTTLDFYVVIIAFVVWVIGVLLAKIDYAIFGLIFIAYFSYAYPRSRRQFATSVLALFKRVRKLHHPLSRRWDFPALRFESDTNIPLRDCAVRLQQLSFDPMIVRLGAVDVKEYQFLLKPLSSRSSTVCVWGTLRYESDSSTKVTYHVGIPVKTYILILTSFAIMIWFFQVERPVPIPPVVSILLVAVIALVNSWIALSSVRQTLGNKLRLDWFSDGKAKK